MAFSDNDCLSPQYTEPINRSLSNYSNNNWKIENEKLRSEIQQRTSKFNEIISLCEYIMKDIYWQSDTRKNQLY